MKTKIFGGIAIVAIALAVAFNVSLNTSKTNNASVLALANVEALASEISSGDACYNCGTYDADKPKVVYCGSPCVYSPRQLPLIASTSYCP